MFPRVFHGRTQEPFVADYKCCSVSMMAGQQRQDLEKGGKIILPASALEQLIQRKIQYPMLFRLSNHKTDRQTHCGVLEFVAEEGRAYLPLWMMNNLLLKEGSLIHVENVSLSLATFAKFQPQSADFDNITNPRAVLENALRGFACLTKGDLIGISYCDKVYELRVLETEPNEAVSIIECDMSVDFAPYLGYERPSEEEPMAIDDSEYTDSSKFRAFSGEGNRLDGKAIPVQETLEPTETKRLSETMRGIPNFNYRKGKITFIRTSR